MKCCDHLPLLDANPGKIRALLDVLAAFRGAAPDVAADQWRRLFEQGQFRKMVSVAEEARAPRLARAKDAIGAVRLQMLRFQVVGQLKSFMANRANGFRDEVLGSSVNDATRHQLLTVNRAGAWFGREPLAMRSRPLKGEVILAEVRRFARTIMRAVLARHRRPRFHRLNPWIDQRQAAVIRKAPGERGTALSGLWATIRGMVPPGGRTGTARAG